ncbi:MAG TPA: Zn-ribbon domain-containing OB-fold protein [Myxococcota bacterium]|nr:Zn-ribbon domain-containing OB-fold protein [Myxococcota bacterium]
MFSWFGKVNFTPHTKVGRFADYLKDGRLMGSKCTRCGRTDFPPRADCPECLSGEFEYTDWSGRGSLMTYTRIDAAPTGFADMVPYIIGLVKLEEGGRLVAWFGESIPEAEIEIDMQLQVVPRVFGEIEEIKVYYTLEKPGTTWNKTPA